eukprot:TRINITY_DN2630_c0_g1_i1.p1 TRINITY_DN2630_c0_g1~~TRINITY_DN2630_c0_g1_i1.p1  ORF type:complete len:304 (-),score=64.68 TRINITY_DN2630_c0_g1_i1:293-1204(-)
MSGTVHVFYSDVMAQFADDKQNFEATHQRRRTAPRKEDNFRPDEKKLRYQRFFEEQTRMQSEAKRLINEQIERKRKEKELAFQKMQQALIDGKSLTQKTTDMLNLNASVKNQKKQMLYNEWQENVFHPIQKNIRKEINSMDSKTLNETRRTQFANFIKSTNENAGLFLDDPNSMQKNNHIKCRVKVNDPVKRVLSKHLEEKMTVDPTLGARERKKLNGREILTATKWGSGQIEATPHGHFSKLTENDDSGVTHVSKVLKASIKLDHFDVPRGREVTDSEFTKGKKTGGFQYPNTKLSNVPYAG